MKNISINPLWAFLVLVTSCGLQQCMKTDQLELLAKQYPPSKEILELVHKNNYTLNIFHNLNTIETYEEMPGLYFKGTNISRLINAEKMRTFIQEKNLTTLGVAKKCLYRIKDRWVIIAEKIEPPKNEPLLNLKTTQHLLQITEEFCFWDWCTWNKYDGITSKNILYDKNLNKFIFIDTENYSFHEAPLGVIREQLLNFVRIVGDKESVQWLKKKIKQSNPE